MKYLILPLTLLVLTRLHLPAQQDVNLPGEVVEQNSQFNTGKVNYLSGVEIKAEGNRTLSDTKGLFTLRFADKPLGASVWVHVAKQGYELVNEEDMKHAAVTGRNTRLKVVMCTAGQKYECQMKYYAIARDAKVEGYNRQIEILQKEGKEQKALLEQMAKDYNVQRLSADSARALLYTQLQDAQRQAKELADKFVTVNLDDQSETYQRAFRAFMAGDVDGAIQVMSTVDDKGRCETNISLIEKIDAMNRENKVKRDSAEKQIKQAVEGWVANARWHELQYRFHEADSLYGLAYQYNRDTADLSIAEDYAFFLVKQHQFKNALEIYPRLLTQYRLLYADNQSAYVDDLARILSAFSLALGQTKEKSTAKLYGEEVMNIYRKLAKDNPEKYAPDLALALSNLGIILYDNREASAARKYIEEALAIYQELASENPTGYLPEVARIFNNLGGVFYGFGDHSKSKMYFHEAIRLYKDLAIKDRKAHLPQLALSLKNLAKLQKSLDENSEARISYMEALPFFRELAQLNAEVYLPDLATTLHNLGTLEISEGNNATAKIFFEEALRIRISCFKENPRTFGIDATRTTLGLCYLVYQELEASDDLRFQSEAFRYINQAKEFLIVFEESNPEVQEFLLLFSEYDQKLRSFDPLRNKAFKAIKHLQTEVQSAKTPHEKMLRQEAVVEAWQALQKQFPNDDAMRTSVASAYGSLAWHHLFDQNPAAAEAAARKGLTLVPDQTWIHTNLALALLYQGKWDEAKAIYLRLKDQPYGDATYAKTFLEDLDALEKAGITHPDVKKARQLLR